MSQVDAITGAAGGISAALAHSYARDGAELVLLGFDADAVPSQSSPLRNLDYVAPVRV